MAFHYTRLCMFVLSAALIRIESSLATTGRALIGRRAAQNADACGSVSLRLSVTDDPDVFSSPGYHDPGQYPTNTTCTWRLVAAAGRHINITSIFINLERSMGCGFDHLVIYDGDSESSQVLGRFCANMPISVITSSNNALVKLVSDYSYTGVGFELSFSATDRAGETQRVATSSVSCNSTFRTSPGLITSPDFPLPPDVNTYCQYTFQAPEGKHVELVFNYFHLEQSTDCQYDNVEIFDGANEDGDSIGDYCGHVSPPLVRSSGRDLFVIYTTDSLYKRGGFNASYQFVSPDQDPLRLSEGHDDCSRLKENETMLSSPGFPAYYPNNKPCVYVLRAPPGQFVQIKFDVFKMEESDGCTFDYLAIYDGLSYDLPASRILCGEQVLPGTTFASKGRDYRLKFQSDQSLTDRGFLLNVTFVSHPTGTVCSLQCGDEGECVQQQLGPMCDCQPPYSGDRCQTVPSDCGSDPCLNGGTCQPEDNSFKCYCQDGLKGDYCQFDDSDKLEFDGPIEVKSSLIRGDDALLQCPASIRGAQVEWIYEDDIRLEKESLENRRRSIRVFDGGVLRILELGNLNTGKYTCVVTDGATSIEQDAHVTIDEPCDIEVTYTPNTATEIIGKQTHLIKCLAEGSSVTYKWLKDEKPLPENSNYEVLVNNFLQISNLAYDNAGKFTCEIMGDKCSKRYTAYLSVVGNTNVNKVCGRPTMSFPGRIQKASRIVGGKSALDGSYPWFVMLYDTVDDKSFCGGSIINNRWIVTAAHCLKELRKGQDITIFSKRTTKAVVGTTHCKGNDGRALTIDKVVIHHGYRGGIYDNDIALLHVKEVINFTPTVQPICLESQSFNEGAFFRRSIKGYVAGCGALNSRLTQVATNLMEVELPIHSRKVCVDSLHSTPYTMTESMFCAGFSKSRGDSCRGDSGGGFVVKSRDRFVLVGVVSWGIGCDTVGQYGFYTNVGRFFNWIHDFIN